MDEGYQCGFYNPVRDEHERQHQSHVQHVACYPVYLTSESQLHPEFGVNHTGNVGMFPASFSDRLNEDSVPVLPPPSTMQRASLQPSVPVVGDQGDDSSILSNYAIPISAHKPAVACNNSQPITTPKFITSSSQLVPALKPVVASNGQHASTSEPVVDSISEPITNPGLIPCSSQHITACAPIVACNRQPVATSEHDVASNNQLITTLGLVASGSQHITACTPIVASNRQPVATSEHDVASNNQLITTLGLIASSSHLITTACTSVVASNRQPVATSEPVVASSSQPITTQEFEASCNEQLTATCQTVEGRNMMHAVCESSEKGDKEQTQGPTLIARNSSKDRDCIEQREQCPTPPNQPCKTSSAHSSLTKGRTEIHPELPQGLSYEMTSQDRVKGVVAKVTIEKGEEFGPLTGALLNEEQGLSKETTWEICISDRVHFYIDGHKNWMSHVRCANSEEEQNVEAYQYYGKIYFRTTKVIEPGSELRTFYSEEYRKHVGIETKLQDLKFNQDAQKFQCRQCQGLFTSVKLILRHMRCDCKHTNEKTDEVLPLPTANVTKEKLIGRGVLKPPFKKQKKVNNEKTSSKVRRSSKKGPVFKCGTCDKVFHSCGKWIAHEKFHEYDQDHTCPICGKRQRNAQAWAKHMMLHKPVQEARHHKCNECNGRYKTKLALRKHINHVHGYNCRICKERFLKKKDCLKHEAMHQSQVILGIPCDGGSSSAAEPATDEPKNMLGKTVAHYLKERPFKCRFCPNTYIRQDHATRHERKTHLGDHMLRCSLCPETFICQSDVLKHMKKHKEIRAFCCTFCPKKFRSESALNNHQGEHTGLKPFKCELCGRGFRVRKGVSEHKRRMHRNCPMRFFCSVCNKGFTDRGNLVKHERRHSGYRPFSCMPCNKTFTAKCSLDKHIQNFHTAEKRFSCEICGKKFSGDEQYYSHMIKHKLKDKNLI